MSVFEWFHKRKMEQRLEQNQDAVEPTRHYLAASAPPVVAGLERFQIALGGVEYATVFGLRDNTQNGRIMTRWFFTPEARAAVAAGADLYLELLTFGKPMQPILLSVAGELDAMEIAEEYGLAPRSQKEGPK